MNIPSKRGRPRSFDEAEVLPKVRAEFLRKGFDATSLDDLSAATGLTRPSLYAAFGNKEEMYLKVLSGFVRQMETALRKEVAQAKDLETALKRVYAAAIDVYIGGEAGRAGCMVMGTAVTRAPVHEDIAHYVTEVFTQMDQAFTNIFAHFGHASTERGALAAAAMQSLSLRARAGQSRESLEAFADSTAKLLSA